MNREFIFDSWFWLISIRYAVIKIIVEENLSWVKPNIKHHIVCGFLAQLIISNALAEEDIFLKPFSYRVRRK